MHVVYFDQLAIRVLKALQRSLKYFLGRFLIFFSFQPFFFFSTDKQKMYILVADSLEVQTLNFVVDLKFFSSLKKSSFHKSMLLRIIRWFSIDVTTRSHLNSYYSMIFIQCYYLVLGEGGTIWFIFVIIQVIFCFFQEKTWKIWPSFWVRVLPKN